METLDIITISSLSFLLIILMVFGYIELYIHKISLKKIYINPKYKTWIFLIFVFFSVSLVSKIWLTLTILFGIYLFSIIYTIIKSRKIKR